MTLNVLRFEPARSHFPVASIRPGYELTVVVPTFNEAANVDGIVAVLDQALADIRYEILFVDDWSPDGTAARVAAITATRGDVRVLRRHGRRGLGSAVIEGMMAASAPVIAVIDGDGQHDEQLLPRLFRLIEGGEADVAVGSRFGPHGSTGEFSEGRLLMSRLANRLARLVIDTPMTDPMSGFFVIRRELAERLVPRLSGRGFKILLDLLSASPTRLAVIELPYRFRVRRAGESKLGPRVALDYLAMIAGRLIRRHLLGRVALFCAVGALGLLVHLGMLRALLGRGSSFGVAQAGAVASAIAFNFLLNNRLTFRDRRLTGWKLLGGLASFYLVCGLGALANVGTGIALFADHARWWASGLAGAIVGAAWNFAAASRLTWRTRPARA